MSRYEIYVGNVGMVWEGTDSAEADKVFTEYQRRSHTGSHRAGGEAIALFTDGELTQEYIHDDEVYE